MSKEKTYMGINPDHKGYCTPMSKPTCTPRRKERVYNKNNFNLDLYRL